MPRFEYRDTSPTPTQAETHPIVNAAYQGHYNVAEFLIQKQSQPERHRCRNWIHASHARLSERAFRSRGVTD
ncbi:hypothetical protein N7532_005796 [Penicillium argentinense]|uniref:Uncharacterized protein n=1 Tax=Penicillium argentinense TaxID=1131581 RepID=A0A9W9FEK4_9EURO|nr:uncharacterized protein N7532_005796 [Penicillium argentinense]KAJ5098795.1 hypothetical protein N7532_005796 [Penicillium argentinense]